MTAFRVILRKAVLFVSFAQSVQRAHTVTKKDNILANFALVVSSSRHTEA